MAQGNSLTSLALFCFSFPVAVVSANIGISYLFLLVFTWVYLGDTVRVSIPIINFERVILRPFRSLKWIMICYAVIGFIEFIVGIYGAFILSLAEFCKVTSPDLYQFSLFVVTLFWVGFFIVSMYAVKLFYGTRLSKIIKDNVRTETMDEVENRLVRSKFLEFDKTREEKVTREDLTKVLQSLGVFVPEEEQEHLIDTLDPDRSGFITLKAFSEWFKAVNGSGGSDKGDDDNSGKDEDAKLFK